jgi:hypothetical protein
MRLNESSAMGVQTDIVIASLNEAQAIADTATPTVDWTGFTFNGFHHVQLCTLLSLLATGGPHTDFERYLGVIEVASGPTEEGPIVFAVKPEQVAELAAVAELEDNEFEALATLWGSTDEFAHWSASDVRELLRELGDLAESALLQAKCLMIWQSL